MLFNLAEHNALYKQWMSEHGPNCLCKRFRDGDPLWQPTPLSSESGEESAEVKKLLAECEEDDGKKFEPIF